MRLNSTAALRLWLVYQFQQFNRHNVKMIQFGEREIDQQLRAYFDDLDKLTQRVLLGELPRDEFRREMEGLVLPLIMTSFFLAGGSMDVPGAQREIAAAQDFARNSITLFADDLYQRRYNARPETEALPGLPAQTATEGRAKLRQRLGLWVYQMGGVYSASKEYIPDREVDGEMVEPRLRWVRGPTREPCRDCLRLDGVILTVSEWRQIGIRPQSPQLECGGWRCLCARYETDAASVGLGAVPI